MSAHRNIKVNITRPRNIRDRTARGIVTALGAGGRVAVADVNAAIRSSGGKPNYKVDAVKGLRNMGYTIVIRKARHLTWYRLDATPAEQEDQRKTLVRELYSRLVSVVRELAGAVAANPADLSLDASHRHGQMMALALGTDSAVGMTVPEVIADLVPL
jgi:hypothetical protein